MLWCVLFTVAAEADPKGPPPQEIEVVRDEPQQGTFRLVYAGREGDTLRVDGWPFGTLPVETELAEGLHTFRIEGAAGKLDISATLVVEADKVVEVDLARAKGPEVKPEASVVGDKPQLRSPSEAPPDAAPPPDPPAN